MLMALMLYFLANSLARFRRSKLSSLNQQRTRSGSAVNDGAVSSKKKPRACDDHGMMAILFVTSHCLYSGVLAAMQPAQGGSTMRAKLKLLLMALKPFLPFFLA